MPVLSFLFYLESPTLSLLEAKVEGLPEGTPKSRVYHWLLLRHETGDFERMAFKSMGDGARSFEQGELAFTSSEGTLKLSGSDAAVVLTVRDAKQVPEDVSAKAAAWLAANPGGQ